MDVDNDGAGAQGKAEGAPGPEGVTGAGAGDAAAGVVTPVAEGAATPGALGTSATGTAGEGEAAGEAADPGKTGEVPGSGGIPGAPVAGEGADADGSGAPGADAQADPPAPVLEAVTVLPVEEHRNGRALKQALRGAVQESGGAIQVAVCSRREWVQAVASAWAESLSAPQAGSGLTGLGPGSAIGSEGPVGDWEKRTICMPPLSLEATAEGLGRASEGVGAKPGTGAGASAGAGEGLRGGAGVRSKVGAGMRGRAVGGAERLTSGVREGTPIAAQLKLGGGKKPGSHQGEPRGGGGAQRPGVGTLETISEAMNEVSGDKGSEARGRGAGEDNGHLLAVVEILLPGVVRAVLSLAPAGSCAAAHLGIFAHNEMGPHVSPWGSHDMHSSRGLLSGCNHWCDAPQRMVTMMWGT